MERLFSTDFFHGFHMIVYGKAMECPLMFLGCFKRIPQEVLICFSVLSVNFLGKSCEIPRNSARISKEIQKNFRRNS